MKKLWFLIIPCMICLSCAVQTHYIQDSSSTLAPTDPATVQIFTHDDLDAEYQVIGSIAADVVGDANAAKVALQKEAAKIGANAVIDVKLTKLSSMVSRTGLSGVAVLINY